MVNPAAGSLAAQIQSKAARRNRQRTEDGAGQWEGPLEVETAEAYQNRQTQLQQTIQAAAEELAALKAQRQQVPAPVTLG